MPTVRVLYFAAAREASNTSEESIELPETAGTSDLISLLVARHPKLQSVLNSCILALNQEYLSQGQHMMLKDKDEVAIIPPLSGG